MTIGSLFSGIGGLELGLERAGLGPVIWQAESDPFARKVLAKHWPGVKIYEDVREVDERAERPGIICGGFPCQDISNAGKRAGIDGEQSGLWAEFIRIVRVLRPEYVLVENVAALLGRGLERVLGDLAKSGFHAEWDVFSAATFGAPHIRERLFLVAYSRERGQYAESPEHLLADPGRLLLEGMESQSRWPEASSVDARTAALVAEGRSHCSDGVGNGVPFRLVRPALHGLGNAVVPQVAEWIGRRILEASR